MSNWIIKAIVQKTISFLPFKHRINHLFQKYVTRGAYLTDALMEDKLTHLRNHLGYFAAHARTERGSALEIGTGWYPIVPIGIYLAGFRRVVTLDIAPLLTSELIRTTIEWYRRYRENGKLASYLEDVDPERFARLLELTAIDEDPQSLLARLGIEVVLGDARSTGFPEDSFDLINSNNTFEHIHPNVLVEIVREFKRILKPGGVMSHHIDMSDHFAHKDPSITVFNFLRFSDSAWRRIDNSIQPQNRLRLSDHRRIIENAGLSIIDQRDWRGRLDYLRSVQLDEKYKGYSEEDLVVTHTMLVMVKE